MKEYAIRVMCCINPERTAQELDRAVAALKGYRSQTLDEPSWWDSWFVPADVQDYVNLFVTRPQDLYRPHPINN